MLPGFQPDSQPVADKAGGARTRAPRRTVVGQTRNQQGVADKAARIHLYDYIHGRVTLRLMRNIVDTKPPRPDVSGEQTIAL